MKQLVFVILTFIFASALTAQAQQRKRLTAEDRQKFLVEMRQYKHDFLVKELDLTRDQQNAFFPIYDKMDDELTQVAEETRDLEDKVAADDKATDTELESAARTLFEQKSKEGEIEKTYFDKFKGILSPRQLLKIKSAERKFTQQLVRQHGRTRNK